MERKMKFAKGETKSEEETARKVVLDYMSVKQAVQTLREFEKEHGLSILNQKGLEQASAILRKYEQQDKLQRLVEERIDAKIAPLDNKLNTLMDMVQTMMGEQTTEPAQSIQSQSSVDNNRLPTFEKDAPEYVKKALKPNQ
jgi:Mg/Co/Ni transporter MgtE